MSQPPPRPVLAYVNGELIPEAEATVSIFDSGLNFGDGVFEGVRVYAGRVFRLEEHVRRLFDSARAFDLAIGMTGAAIAEAMLAWLAANGVRDDFHFRPIVTRGNRHPPRSDPRFVQGGPTIIFLGAAIAPASLEGLRVVVSSYRRPSPDSLDPRVKSLSFAGGVLPKLEASRVGADDAVVLDAAGFVAEGSTANVFLVSGGRLHTPRPTSCLAGITRQVVIDEAKAAGLAVEERDLSPTELLSADEAFFTGTGAEITPIVEVTGRVIGDGTAGPLTRELARRYATLVRSEGTPIPSAGNSAS
jgi:branched-chain amino acid aminotransferase